jgi:hypothetical protein
MTKTPILFSSFIYFFSPSLFQLILFIRPPSVSMIRICRPLIPLSLSPGLTAAPLLSTDFLPPNLVCSCDLMTSIAHCISALTHNSTFTHNSVPDDFASAHDLPSRHPTQRLCPACPSAFVRQAHLYGCGTFHEGPAHSNGGVGH